MLRPLHELFEQDGFWAALVVGSLCALGFVCVWRVRAGERLIAAVGGVFCAAAVGISLVVDRRVDDATGVIFGVALLAAGGFAARFTRWFALRLLLAVPGAAVVTTAVGEDLEQWLSLVVFVGVAVGAAAVSEWRSWAGMQGAGPSLLVLTLAGVYFCVPDTEQAAVAFGVALPLLALGWPARIGEIGPGGGAAWVGMVAWLAVSGGAARPGAIVGAIACIGMLGSVPVLRWSTTWLRAHGSSVRGWVRHPTPVLVVVHFLVVIGCSRLAGRRDSAWASAVIALVVLAAGVVALLALVPVPGADRRAEGVE